MWVMGSARVPDTRFPFCFLHRFLPVRASWRNLPFLPFLAATVCVGLGGVAGCDGQADPVGAGCVSELEQFQREVSLPVLEKRCQACHTATGVARHSKLVLATPSESNYLSRNLEALRALANYEYDSVPLLLAKPTNSVAHGGGARIDVGGAEYKALERLLARFDAPVSCNPQNGAGGLLDRVQFADLGETLRRAKLQLLGELPTDSEFEQMATGEAEQAFRELVAGYMTDTRFLDRVVRWTNERLHTDKYLGGRRALDLLDPEDFPDRYYFDALEGAEHELAKRHANDGVAREPLNLVAWVVGQGRPFTEILTADYMVLNPYAAQAYGVWDAPFADPTDPSELLPVLVGGMPHAGVLTSPMFLNRFPTTDTNLNRHRSRWVWRLFLATDVLEAGERPLDPTQVKDHNPTMNNPVCAKCHAEVDPVAGAFQNWDDRGRLRPPEEGWPEHLRPPGFGGEAIPADQRARSLQWLGDRIVADERFALAAVELVYQGLIGREPVHNPTDPTDPAYDARLAFYTLEQQLLHDLASTLRAAEMDLRVVVPELLLSPFYRAVAAAGELSAEEAAALAPLGTAQVLGPERLHDRIVAVTGYPWQRRVGDKGHLLDPNELNGVDMATNSHTVGTRHQWSGKLAAGYPALAALIAGIDAGGSPLAFLTFGGYDFTSGVVAPTRLGNLGALQRIAFPNRVDGDPADDTFHSPVVWERIQAAQRGRRDVLLGRGLVPRAHAAVSRLFAARDSDNELRHLTDTLPSTLADNALQRQVQLSMAAFRSGVAKCASLTRGGFDTHGNHDAQHVPRLADLLAGVDFAWQEAERLDLADDLVVVIGSDFGRTPHYNGGGGKDHWSVSSMILMGHGIVGDRVVGATTHRQEPVEVHPATLTTAPAVGGIRLEPKHVHRALRALAGVSDDALVAGSFPLADAQDLPLLDGGDAG